MLLLFFLCCSLLIMIGESGRSIGGSSSFIDNRESNELNQIVVS